MDQNILLRAKGIFLTLYFFSTALFYFFFNNKIEDNIVLFQNSTSIFDTKFLAMSSSNKNSRKRKTISFEEDMNDEFFEDETFESLNGIEEEEESLSGMLIHL